MTYYIKGGSRYNAANPKVWVGLFLGGFPDADYLLTDWVNLDDKGHETVQDPFWRLGGSSGGAKEFELGLWGDYRLKFETTGITYWDGNSWEDLLAEGGAENLNELADVVITDVADNELLAWDVGSSKWINQTAAEAGLATTGNLHAEVHILATTGPHTGTLPWTDLSKTGSNLTDLVTRNHNDLLNINAGDAYEHITQTQKNLLHSIYTLEQHDNNYHSTNYHTETDGTGAVTIHSGITDAGSGIIISTGERTALHPKDHDNTEHTTNYEVAFSKNTAFNKDFGTLGTEVCVGNDARLSDDRNDADAYHITGVAQFGLVAWKSPTLHIDDQFLIEDAEASYDRKVITLTVLRNNIPTKSHNNTYHDPDYCVDDDSRLSDARTPTQHNNDYHSTNYHSETDGIGVVTVHSDITSVGSGAIITTGERNALHPIVTSVYNLKALDDRDYKPNTSDSYGFVKAFFTSLGGMTGVADSDYQDLLILNTYTDGSGGDINALTFDKSTQLIKHWLADQAAATWGTPKTLAYVEDTYTQAQVDAIEARFDEQSSTFPGSPVEGDLHYDEDDDSLYRYNAEALAWIEVGAGGGGVAAEIDNLGNHTATENLAMAGFQITGVGNVDGVDVSALKTAHDTLQTSHDTLQTQVDDLPQYIWVSNKPWSHTSGQNYGEGVCYANASGEQVRFSCKIPADADTSKDVYCWIMYKCDSADASISYLRYQSAMGNGEAQNWTNIANGVGDGLVSSVLGNLYHEIFSYAAASIGSTDTLFGIIKLNEASRTVYFYDVLWRFEKA